MRCSQLERVNKPGFDTPEVRAVDGNHLNQHGQRHQGEMVMEFFEEVAGLCSGRAGSGDQSDDDVTSAQEQSTAQEAYEQHETEFMEHKELYEPHTLPSMIPGLDQELATLACAQGDNLPTSDPNITFQPGAGWNFQEDVQGKWGYVTYSPGSVLGIHWAPPRDWLTTKGSNASAVLSLGYLASYDTRMGKAAVRCISGCTCQPVEVDARWSARISVTTFLHVRLCGVVGPVCELQVHTISPSQNQGAAGVVVGGNDGEGTKFKVGVVAVVTNTAAAVAQAGHTGSC